MVTITVIGVDAKRLNQTQARHQDIEGVSFLAAGDDGGPDGAPKIRSGAGFGPGPAFHRRQRAGACPGAAPGPGRSAVHSAAAGKPDLRLPARRAGGLVRPRRPLRRRHLAVSPRRATASVWRSPPVCRTFRSIGWVTNGQHRDRPRAGRDRGPRGGRRADRAAAGMAALAAALRQHDRTVRQAECGQLAKSWPDIAAQSEGGPRWCSGPIQPIRGGWSARWRTSPRC